MHTTATLVQANLLFHLDSSPRLHESEIRSVVSNSLRPHGILQARYTGVGSLSILQGIFPTQGSNTGSHIAGRFFPNWAMEFNKILTSECIVLK